MEEAAQLGEVQVALWFDETVRAITGEAPKFPQAERAYCEANRLGYHVVAADTLAGFPNPDLYAVNEDGDKSAKKEYYERHGIGCVRAQAHAQGRAGAEIEHGFALTTALELCPVASETWQEAKTAAADFAE